MTSPKRTRRKLGSEGQIHSKLREMPVTLREANRLFSAWKVLPSIVLAVSGGPDSVALMWLVARWRERLASGPRVFAVTIDHGLRESSAAEARQVHRLARELAIEHQTLRWRGPKPATGIPAAARDARYRLLAKAGRVGNASHIVTAHTQDDQAETLMMRMARGSGLAGLAAMKSETLREDGVTVLRPFLDLPKARLIATLKRAGVSFAEDPTNHDIQFTRPRWRALMPSLAEEGLDSRGLARLATRLGRANAAIDTIVNLTERSISRVGKGRAIEIDARAFATLPDEIALRLLGRAIAATGREGPVELAKLESLFANLRNAFLDKHPRLKQTLAGVVIAMGRDLITLEVAPPRRRKA